MPSQMAKIKKLWGMLDNKSSREAFISTSIDNSLSGQIQAIRQQRGMTQKELAEVAGMRQSRISTIEHDPSSVNLKTLKRIAQALDIALSVQFVPYSEFIRSELSEATDQSVVAYTSDTLDGLGFEINTTHQEPSPSKHLSFAEGSTTTTKPGDTNVTITI